MRIADLLQPVAGSVFGAGLASITHLSATTAVMPSFGPAAVIAFGYEVPVLPALFGLIGLLLARRVAPASDAGARLGRTGNAALTGLLAIGVLALVISGQRQILVALGWSIGLGYSGLAFIELVAASALTFARLLAKTYITVRTAVASDWLKKESGDE